MLDRIVMNVIDVALQIQFVTDQVFPEASLPKISFTPRLPR